MSLLRAGFRAIGTTATVVARNAGDLVVARRVLEDVLDELDRACSRFRTDSELAQVQRAAGRAVPVGPMLWESLLVAGRAVAATDGLVDPTVGTTLVELGYDRDFAELDECRPLPPACPSPGWDAVELDAARRTVCVAPGVILDLGATAKALAIDIAVADLHDRVTDGVLVEVGGDLALCGPAPTEGWPVRVADSHLAGPNSPGPVVVLHDGALATSAPSVRRWGPSEARRHHIVDPRTGRPAPEVWRSVSVAAASCVDANIASTAAVLLGADAPTWLGRLDLPALLRGHTGSVTTTGGWPGEVAA